MAEVKKHESADELRKKRKGKHGDAVEYPWSQRWTWRERLRVLTFHGNEQREQRRWRGTRKGACKQQKKNIVLRNGEKKEKDKRRQSGIRWHYLAPLPVTLGSVCGDFIGIVGIETRACTVFWSQTSRREKEKRRKSRSLAHYDRCKCVGAVSGQQLISVYAPEIREGSALHFHCLALFWESIKLVSKHALLFFLFACK